jgi:hypothetical protein
LRARSGIAADGANGEDDGDDDGGRSTPVRNENAARNVGRGARRARARRAACAKMRLDVRRDGRGSRRRARECGATMANAGDGAF